MLWPAYIFGENAVGETALTRWKFADPGVGLFAAGLVGEFEGEPASPERHRSSHSIWVAAKYVSRMSLDCGVYALKWASHPSLDSSSAAGSPHGRVFFGCPGTWHVLSGFNENLRSRWSGSVSTTSKPINSIWSRKMSRKD